MDIVQARQDNLEAVKNIYRQSAQVLAQQGFAGQNLELLIVVLPDGANASDCYGKHIKWLFMVMGVFFFFFAVLK